MAFKTVAILILIYIIIRIEKLIDEIQTTNKTQKELKEEIETLSTRIGDYQDLANSYVERVKETCQTLFKDYSEYTERLFSIHSKQNDGLLSKRERLFSFDEKENP